MSENVIFQQNYISSLRRIPTKCVTHHVEYVERFFYGLGCFIDQCGWWLELAPLDENPTIFYQYTCSEVQCLCTPWSRSGSWGI